MTESEEATQLRKKLLRLDKNEVAKKCKRKHLSTGGKKSDMVERLVEYNEENGGVTGAREGSNKNKKKGSTAAAGAGAGGAAAGSKKQKNKSGGDGGGRSNTRSGGNNNNNDGGAQCYCNCGGDNGNQQDDEQVTQRRLIGGVIGAIGVLLFIVALIVNVLSKFSSDTVTVTCRWNEVRGCVVDTVCNTINYDDHCDLCELNNDGDCDTCDTKSGGKWWLTLNILALFISLIGVIGVFTGHYVESAQGFVKWVKLFYIVPAIFAFLAVIAWVGSNGYRQSCYDPDNDLGLGASNIIDIINGILLIVGFVCVF